MNVGDSILSNTYILFWQLCILVSEMAESTQREDLTMGEEFHEKTGVLGGNMSKISPSKTERGLDLESINIDF